MIILEKVVEGARQAALLRFSRKAQKLAGVTGEVDILVAGNRRLQQLNRRFRKKDRPTDVLSFPGNHGGDIAISADMAQENALRYGHSAAEELKILILHGILHLAGYDHESDGGQMARIESKLRAQLRLPSSLIGRTANVTKKRSAYRRWR